MWIFTVFGFFSVVDAGRGNVQVRARHKQHLVRLLKFLGDSQVWVIAKIFKNDEADYRYRMVVPVAAWTGAVLQLAKASASVRNFKTAAEHQVGGEDPDYVVALHRVWSIMHEYQQDNDERANKRKAASRVGG
jgi:hypothetical protein